MDFGCEQIYCISLVDRKDKQQYFSSMMKELGIKFNFFPAIKDIHIPSRGCFQSHFQIISNAYKKGLKRIMIFEDDVGIVKIPDKNIIRRITHFLDNQDGWDIFFLGCSPYIWNTVLTPTQGYSNIFKGHFLATHCYILSEQGIKRFSNIKWGKPHKLIDMDVYRVNQNSYAYLPEIYYQRPVKNDIGKNTKAFLKLRTSGADFLTWYAMNFNIPAKTMLIIILTIIVSLIICIHKKTIFNHSFLDKLNIRK